MGNLYDEKEAISHVKALHPDGRSHLSHVVRNGLMSVLSAYCMGGDVHEEIKRFEKTWHATFGL